MRRHIILLAILMGQVPGMAAAAQIACPASIMETPVLADTPEGWRLLATQGERVLDTAGLNSGDPADAASLVPDDTTMSKASTADIWNLEPGAEYWVACTYVNTSAQLFQKVPAGARSCSARYALLSGGQRDRLEAVACE